jgi:2',3'-cyclic-nucleotide 2'-phosphodiesterase (5'-nucleotidase family)
MIAPPTPPILRLHDEPVASISREAPPDEPAAAVGPSRPSALVPRTHTCENLPVSSVTTVTAAPGNIAHLRILSINDLHGQLGDSEVQVGGVGIGSAATLSAYAQLERAADPSGTVLVSAGDAIGASPPASTLLGHKPTFATMAAMGVDVATMGNHEFDGGFAKAMRLIYGDGPIADAAEAAQGLTKPGSKRKRLRGAGKLRWPGSAFPWVSSNLVDV